MKKAAIVVAGLILVLVAAGLIVPSFIDWNSYKPDIIAAAKEATGRDLAIDGDLTLTILPSPALSVASVRLASIPGAGQPDMIRLKSLQVEIALRPLLGGKIAVQRVRLIEPEIVLEKLADGRVNWDLAPPAKAAPDSEDGSDSGSEKAGAPDDDGLDISLEEISIEDGVLIYRDAAGTEERIENLSLDGSAVSLQGPFTASGQLRARGLPLTFNARVGALEGGRPTPLRVQVKHGGQKDAALDFAGTLSAPTADGTLSGKLKINAADPTALMAAIAPGTALPPALARPFSLESSVSASAAEAALNDVNLQLGDLKATGALTAGFADGVSFDATLAVNRIDVDALLAIAAPADTAAAKPTGDGDKPPQDGGAAAAGPTIPTNVRGSLHLTAEGMTLFQGVLRQVQLAATIADGRITLSRATALLPGGSDFNLSGFAAVVDDAPQFDGRFELASDNLRGLLTWLKTDLSQVPAGRLGNLSLTSNVRVTPALAQVFDVNLRLDATTLTGGGAVRLQQRPSFAVDLAIDKVNVDGYMPIGPSPAAREKDDNDKKAKPAPGKTATGKPADKPAAAKPLAMLDSFDSNVKVKIGQITYNKTPITGINLDLSLVGGLLTVRRASVQNIIGTSLALSATANGFAADPAFKVNLNVAAKDLTGLARLTKVELPVPAKKLGAANLSAAMDGNMSALGVSAQASLAGATFKARGRVAQLQTTPVVDLDLDAAHKSLRALSSTFSLGLSINKKHDGPVSLTGSVKGPLTKMASALTLGVAGGTTAVKGDFGIVEAGPRFDLAVSSAHENFEAMLVRLGVAYRPPLTKDKSFKLDVAAKGDGDDIALTKLNAKVGPLKAEGAASVRLSGKRPYVDATLKTNDIVTDHFIAKAKGAKKAGGAKAKPNAPPRGGERWSRERIDLAALELLDADVTLTASRLVFEQYPFVNPRLALRLKDGALTIKQLTGTLFDGQVTLTGLVRGRPLPAVALKLDLAKADINKALKTAAQLDTVTGKLDFAADLNTQGVSQWEMVNQLSGSARMKAQNGVIRGADLKSVSDRLGRLNKIPDFFNLMSRAFAGGETKYQSLTGTWRIERGIARTTDTKAALDATAATTRGKIALPAWNMDLANRVRLTEHADAPDFGVRLYGPLDQPQHKRDTKALQAYVAQKVGTAVLRKAVGKGKLKGLDKLLGGGAKDSGSKDGGSKDSGSKDSGSKDGGDKLDPAKLLEGLFKKK